MRVSVFESVYVRNFEHCLSDETTGEHKFGFLEAIFFDETIERVALLFCGKKKREYTRATYRGEDVTPHEINVRASVPKKARSDPCNFVPQSNKQSA